MRTLPSPSRICANTSISSSFSYNTTSQSRPPCRRHWNLQNGISRDALTPSPLVAYRRGYHFNASKKRNRRNTCYTDCGENASSLVVSRYAPTSPAAPRNYNNNTPSLSIRYYSTTSSLNTRYYTTTTTSSPKTRYHNTTSSPNARYYTTPSSLNTGCYSITSSLNYRHLTRNYNTTFPLITRYYNTTTSSPPTTIPPSRKYTTSSHHKPYYITTPIFYVNAAPHIGHLYSMVIADVLKRYQQLRDPDRSVILCTGTDEHGMKVQRASLAAGFKSPQLFCNRGATVFQELAAAADISNDHFVRTTDADHIDTVQHAWTVLQDRGFIYLDKHEGWYSVSDETFYPQSQVQAIVEPATGRKIMASIETGKEVEWTSETNYKFRLSAMRDQLLRFYRENPQFIMPNARMREVVQAVELGLEDLSVSRPVSRLTWGVPVPTDSSQTIYVWLDALINYITKAGYPWPPGSEEAKGWPADVQVIGKDIVRFHCIYWPAFLLALGLPPPRQVLTHAHWTLGREKMAKSTGNVVNPFLIIHRFGVDVLRYYLAHDGGIRHDADFGNNYIIERYKKGLHSGLGNLVSRVTRGKGWSVRRAVQRYTQAVSGIQPNSQAGKVQMALIQDLPRQYELRMKALDVSGAIKLVMELIYSTNTYMQHAAPWDLVKSLDKSIAAGSGHGQSTGSSFKLSQEKEGAAEAEIDEIIFLVAEALRVSAILLQPVMPSKMAKLLDMLGVHASARSWVYVNMGVDEAYGVSSVQLGRGTVGVLFPPLDSDT